MSELLAGKSHNLLADFNKLSRLSVDEDALQELHRKELFPYDDDMYFSQRLSRRSRVIRQNNDLSEIIKEALTTDDLDELVAADAIASQLDTWSYTAPNHISRVIDHLNFCMELDDIKVAATSIEHPSDRSNYLMHQQAGRLVRHTPIEETSDLLATLAYTRMRLIHLKQSTQDEMYDFCYSKNEALFKTVSNRLYALTSMKNLLPDDEKIHTAEEIEKDSKDVENVFSEILSTRTHGISLGYVDSSLGGSYVFSDPQLIIEEWKRATLDARASVLVLESPIVAAVTHSSYAHPRYLKPKVFKSDANHKHISLGTADLKPLNYLNIAPDGELHSNFTCDLPLAEAAAILGKYEGYRSMQAEVIGHFYNLTHADHIDVSQVHNQGRAPLRTAGDQEAPIELIRRLIVPRITTNNSNNGLVTTGETRTVKFHGVTWHRRKLPAGWNPSPDALKLADETGIVLEKGETFVRAHERGVKALGVIAGHQFVQRS